MKKRKLSALVISVILCLALASCTTVEISVPGGAATAVLGSLFGGANVPSASVNTQADTPATEAPATDAPTAAPSGDATTAAPATEAPATAAPATEAPAAEAPATEAPATAAPATEAPATEAPTAAPSSGAPTTKEEIIRCYVTAYNKIAAEAKTITRTYDYTSNYDGILEINNNSTLESLAGTLMKQFMVENKEPLTMDPTGIPPVGVATLNLTPDKISSAECKDNGASYEITLKSTGSKDNWEIDSTAETGSAGSIGPLLKAEDVSNAAGSLIKFEGLHTWYGTASVKATVDKATGHITAFHFETPSVLHFDKVTAAVFVKVSNCNIGLLFTQDYTLTY